MSGSDQQEDGEAQGASLPDPAAAPGEGAVEAGEESGLLAELLESQTPRARGPLLYPSVGRLCGWDAARGPVVDFPENPGEPLPARSTVELDAESVSAALAAGRAVLLSFEGGRPERPIITGLLQPSPAEQANPELGAAEQSELALDPSEQLETRIDGRRVELEAADEIVLRCGKASIVLRRNGRVVIRGTYVETRSRGVNRIKGGSVEIN